MTWKMNRNEAKDLLRRWGNTAETIQYLELREALRHAAGEDTGEIGGQIRQVTAFEARMDEWMDSHITTREAKVMLLRYGGKKKWGEWKTVYEGTQAALPKGEPLALEGIGSRTVRIVTEDGTSVDLDIETGSSGMALRAVLLRGDIVLTMDVANNMMSTRGRDATDAIRLGVPLNHVTFHSYRKGDIYMNDCGGLSFQNETRKRGINGTLATLKASSALLPGDQFMISSGKQHRLSGC